MARNVKELMVKELVKEFDGVAQRGCVVLDYKGITASEAVLARQVMGKNGAAMRVVKNSMFCLALQELGAPQLRALIEGPAAVVMAEDAVQAAKSAEAAVGVCKAIHVCGGLCGGRVLDAQGVQKLARIPELPVLLAQLAGCLTQPLQGFAGCLASLLRQFVVALDALRQKKAEEQAG